MSSSPAHGARSVGGVHGATCARHTEVLAVEVCSRCGAFLCPQCVEYLGEVTPVCEACAQRAAADRPGALAWSGVVLSSLGLLGMVLGFAVRGRPGLWAWAVAAPLGLLGLGASLRALATSPTRSASGVGQRLRLARLGGALGVLHALAVAVVAALFGLFWWASGGRP